MKRSIWIGYDPREIDALQVCHASIKAHLSEDIPIHVVDLTKLGNLGLYQRPTQRRGDQLFDVISDAPMSTEFAISRFFLPHICGDDWAVFMDCDMLVRADMAELFRLGNHQCAVQVVKHDYKPAEQTKMDGQTQTAYARKNWSSVMLWNLRHSAIRLLTLAKLNTWSGRALHQFRWLDECDRWLGELGPEWNHLVGVDPPDPDAKIVHFTLGIPRMSGYENCEFAEEWRAELQNVPSS